MQSFVSIPFIQNYITTMLIYAIRYCDEIQKFMPRFNRDDDGLLPEIICICSCS